MAADEVGTIDEFTPFLEAYPDYDLTTLPSWVADDIENAKVYGNKKRGVLMPDGQKYHLDNKLNEAYKNALESIASDIVKKYSKYLEEFRFEV